MKRFFISITIVTSLFFSLKTSFAGETASRTLTSDKVSFGIGVKTGYLYGDTRYHITFPLYEEGFTTGESELKFPLNSFLGGLNASIGKRGVWSVDLSILKNLTEDTGKTKDSDWLTYSPTFETVKWSYAEADTDMDALLIDISGKYYIFKGGHTSLGLIGGYRYQNLSFDISNASMESPVGWFPREDLPGKVSTYEITYSLPYGGLAFDLKASEQFSLNLKTLYGKAYAKDEDDHILRTKRSTSDADGKFYLLRADGNITVRKNLSIIVALEYLKIDVDGVQTQTWYGTTAGEPPAGTTIGNIDYWAKTEQTYIYAGIRYIF